MALSAAERSAELLERLRALHPRIIDLSLERMMRLLAALDYPQKRLPPVVHVAGTNGKGSFVAHTRAIFEASGYRVHTYISPHLVRFNERIVLGGRTISDEALADTLERVELANGNAPITFFEVTTAAAFLAFSQFPADVLLLEVGLGGRLDATNVIDNPLLSAITPVSLDHQHYLGETIGAIAAEKAGIIKKDCPVVIGRQEQEAMVVISRTARDLNAPVCRFGQEWTSAATPEGYLRYQDDSGTLVLPRSALQGPHQYDNAGLAVAAALKLRKKFQKITALTIAEGLKQTRWPARMQRLTGGPLVDLLPKSVELWLDGGHNPGAGEALAPLLAGWKDRPVVLVVGMIDSKDPSGFLRPMMPHVQDVRTVDVPGEHASIPADKLATVARDLGMTSAASSGSVAEALRELADKAEGGRILICGSLYLAGHVLAECHLNTCDDESAA